MGEQLSFYKLFVEKGYTIEIPKIQRDYAQGRASASEIRKDFLTALFNYLIAGIPFRDLDFVYGEVDSNGKFIPLDGQQRLTTLFLLHWYVSIKDNKRNELREVLCINGNSKFSYNTRQTSVDFCNALLESSIDLNNLLPPDKDRFNKLSKTIKDSSWYFLSWDNDPTIQSMLCMLDAINEQFNQAQGFYQKLTDLDSPIITFQFLDLKYYELTDDLYIKMNSRGKPLTKFENFKAKFEQHLNNFNNTLEYPLLLKNIDIAQNISRYFAHKIDTDWADLFWTFKDKKDNIYDSQIMSFVSTIAINNYALAKNSVIELIDNQSKLPFNFYKEQDQTFVKTLITAFDLLSASSTYLLRLNNFHYYNELEIFNIILNPPFSDRGYLVRIQFFAYYSYLVKWNGKEEKELFNWMRVIANLSENTTPYNNDDEFISSIRSINSLLPESNAILEFLKKEQRITGFNPSQVKEEQIKAHLITKNNLWFNEIMVAEKHRYFKGQLTFALAFSGIEEYFDKNKNCNWNAEEDRKYFSNFKSYIYKIFALFNNEGLVKEAEENYLWHRAILSKGNYLLNAKRNRSFLINIERDVSWKRLLQGEGDRKEKREYVKQILDDDAFIPEDLRSLYYFSTDSGKNIPKYMQLFINQPKLFDYLGRYKFIRYKDDEHIYLLKGIKTSGEHSELFSLSLYLKLADNLISEPFDSIKYYFPSGESEEPCFYLDNWKYSENNFAINIYYHQNGEFKISFFDRNSKDFPDFITEVLTDNLFSEFDSCFKIILKEDMVKDYLEKICQLFNAKKVKYDKEVA